MLRRLDIVARTACLALSAGLILLELTQPLTALGFMLTLHQVDWAVVLVEAPWVVAACLTLACSVKAFQLFANRQPRAGWMWLLTAMFAGSILGWGASAIISASQQRL